MVGRRRACRNCRTGAGIICRQLARPVPRGAPCWTTATSASSRRSRSARPSSARACYEPRVLRSRAASRQHRAAALDHFPVAERERLSDLEEFMLGDLTVHLPASMCQRLDRASMAHSLEARVPFLSHHFVDFAPDHSGRAEAQGTPANMCFARRSSRGCRQAARTSARSGFQLPLADWFMGGFNDFAREAWRSSGAAELACSIPGRRAAVRRASRRHRRPWPMLYAIAMFSCWWKQQKFPRTAKHGGGPQGGGRFDLSLPISVIMPVHNRGERPPARNPERARSEVRRTSS